MKPRVPMSGARLKYAKQKGREAENDVASYIVSRGVRVERRRLTGVSDCGDLCGWHGVVIQVKNERRISLAGYVEELEEQIGNADKRFPVESGHTGFCVVKRKGKKSAGDWYATLPLSRLMDIMCELESLRARARNEPPNWSVP